MGNKIVEGLSSLTTSAEEVTSDILLLQFTVVTACIVDKLGLQGEEWVLIDTGLENSKDFILRCAEERFGRNSRPKCIILTHGHFDHVGSVISLSEHWDVPVYAHKLEMPYLTGKKDYPLGDSSVGGGMVAAMSPTFPHTSINLGERIKELPEDGSIPNMTGWMWIHTPGHTEGHISLFRQRDRILITGDAFTTVKQESLLSVITQKEEVSGPPAYLTTDWDLAKKSIENIKSLNPSLAIMSHGHPIGEEELGRHLDMLLRHFDEIAVPERGVFVHK